MPKILILLHDGAGSVASLADAVAEGARAVRFAEVDVRVPPDAEDAGARVRRLGAAEELASYDAVVACGADADGIAALLRRGVPLLNRVGSALDAAATAPAPLLGAMAALGMVVVAPASGVEGEGAAIARALGQRVAEVAGWVTHARSHHHHH